MLGPRRSRAPGWVCAAPAPEGCANPPGSARWGGVGVPSAVSPRWLGDSGLIALGGLRLCSILCLVGDWESAPSPSLSPPCSQRNRLQAGGAAEVWGCAEPQLVKVQGSRSPGAALCWGHLWGGLWGLQGQEVNARGRLGPVSVSRSSLPSRELSARHLSCVMGKQRGAPAGEGCWIPAGAKAASGRDGERAVACARHGGRDAPPGLRAAFLMESRARAAPVSG